MFFFVVWVVDKDRAHVAQLAEHILGKDEVSGSIPLMGSKWEPGGGRAWNKTSVRWRKSSWQLRKNSNERSPM